MVTIEIELSQSQYDNAASIASRLYQENTLNEPKVEELIDVTLKILINEYVENPQSVVTYFKKRNPLDTIDGREG